MRFKPYKSPLGFFFTAEEEAMYHRAIEGARTFFEKFGKGSQPRTRFGIVSNPVRYHTPLYYENPVGSLQVMEEKAQAGEEPNGEWMTAQQISSKLGWSTNTITQKVRELNIPFTHGRPVKGSRGRGVMLMRLADVEQAIGNKYGTYTGEYLTEEEYATSKWMCISEMAQVFKVSQNRLSALICYHKVAYKIYPYSGRRYYHYPTIKELDCIKNLVRRFNP